MLAYVFPRPSRLCQLVPGPPTDVPIPAHSEDAIQAAIRDYHKKRKAGGQAAKSGHIDVSMSAATGKTEAQAHPGSGAV